MIVENLECSYLLNYKTKNDASTGCIFTNVFGNTSIYFNILDTYKGFPIDLKTFEIVEFHESVISRVPPSLLDYFSNVEILDMTNCSLGSVCGIDGGTKLIELHASHNHIKNIGEKIFFYNKELKHIDLSYNQLQSFKSQTFSYPKNLKYLNLAGNRINYISPAFFYLHKVEDLDLSFNEIEKLITHPLSGLFEVRTLKFEGNSISDVPPVAFYKMKKLNRISLKNNTLSELLLNFTSKHIHEVDVSMNSLQQLEILTSIQKLDASFNELKKLIISPGIEIKNLDIKHNLFKDLSSIRSLKNLRSLSLSFNHISHITYRTFYGLDKLRFLDISNNEIKHINMNNLLNLHGLYTLKLNDNDLSNIKLPMYENVLPSLKEIIVSGNPFSCKYLQYLILETNQRGWRLGSSETEVNEVENSVRNIPCYTENQLQECRRELEEIQISLNDEIKKLHEEIGGLYARLENEMITTETPLTRINGTPFFRKQG